MFVRVVAFLFAVFLAASASSQGLERKSEKQAAFEESLVKGTSTAEGLTSKWALYVPADYDASKPWPLIVFLHGAGERGEDGLRQTKVGIGPELRDNPDRFPCLVLMPQCPTRSFWPVGRSNAVAQDAISQMQEPPNPTGTAQLIRDALEQVKANYNVDLKRIALTGLSMGGFGSFKFGADNIDEFSCIMAICGGGDPALAPALAKRPMRVFHGSADPVVAPARSIEMVEAIKAAGGDVTYTEYPGVMHDSWVQAYGDAENIAWLLAQSLP